MSSSRLFANRTEWITGSALAALLGFSLAFFFLPTLAQTAASILKWVGNPPGWSPARAVAWSFPVVALIFYASLPAGPHAPPDADAASFFRRSLPLPLGIAMLYGGIRSHLVGATGAGGDWGWILVATPLGEELLFRGWLYTVLERLTRARFATPSNPLPFAIWLSSLAFALWHLQNLATEGVATVAIEVVYSFFAGIWLGVLRWKSGRLLQPIAAHALLNAAAMV